MIMKNFKLIIILSFLSFSPLVTLSQEKSHQAFWIHEDKVKPSQIEAYEIVTKDLVAACKKYSLQEAQWLTLKLNDDSYLYVTPIENLADLDKNTFETLADKMGDDKVNALFECYNSTYDEHGDYIMYLNNSLSYMPDGMTQTPEGQDYRTMYYNYVTPENDKNFANSLKNIKESFEKHNSKVHYRVYKTGFGVMGTYYMIAVASESALARAKASDENRELMGGEFAGLLKELNKYVWKSDEKRGWIRSDLSYKPAQ